VELFNPQITQINADFSKGWKRRSTGIAGYSLLKNYLHSSKTKKTVQVFI